MKRIEFYRVAFIVSIHLPRAKHLLALGEKGIGTKRNTRETMRFVCTASRLNYAKVLTMTNDANGADAKRGKYKRFSITDFLLLSVRNEHRSDIAKIRKIGTSVFASLKFPLAARTYILFETMHRANRYSTCTKRSSVITAIPFGASL